MENPNTWTDCQKLIHKIIQDYTSLKEVGYVGYSLPTQIYMALKEAGYIMEIRKKYEKEPTLGGDDCYIGRVPNKSSQPDSK
jgi:hypothetical protein